MHNDRQDRFPIRLNCVTVSVSQCRQPLDYVQIECLMSKELYWICKQAVLVLARRN
jgi:hypothetical protein